MSVLYQYSHFLAVSKGFYEGSLSVGELKKHGNIGLGAFNALNGELIAIDNQFYHCSNGYVRIAEDNEMLPWAAVTNFTDNHIITVRNILSQEELQAVLLENLSSKNYPIALHIKAHATNIAFGSVPKQDKPYKTIAEIIDDSILMNTGEVEVDMAGFYAPEFMFPMKSKGIHLHFVDKKRNIGGHVLEMQLVSAQIYWQQLNSVNIIFPQTAYYENIDLSPSDNIPEFKDRLKHSK